VRQLWSGESREAGEVAGLPHQVLLGPGVAQQGAGVLSKSDSLVGVMEEMYRKVERIEIWQKKLTKDFKDKIYSSVDL